MRETPAMLERRPLAVLCALLLPAERPLVEDMADMRPLAREPLAEPEEPEEEE